MTSKIKTLDEMTYNDLSCLALEIINLFPDRVYASEFSHAVNGDNLNLTMELYPHGEKHFDRMVFVGLIISSNISPLNTSAGSIRELLRTNWSEELKETVDFYKVANKL